MNFNPIYKSSVNILKNLRNNISNTSKQLLYVEYLKIFELNRHRKEAAKALKVLKQEDNSIGTNFDSLPNMKQIKSKFMQKRYELNRFSFTEIED